MIAGFVPPQESRNVTIIEPPSGEVRTRSTERHPMVQILLLTLARTMVNVTRRFAYPFVPAISRELQVMESSVQTVMGLQAGIGITSPFFGPLSERFGRKRVMQGMLLMMTGAAALGTLLPVFTIFLPVMILFGAGKMIFDPAMQAFIGDRIPYQRRGTALGIMELAWAAALIFSGLVVGWLLENSTLQAVFAVMTVALLASAGLVSVIMPADAPGRGYQRSPDAVTLRGGFRLIRQHPAALAALWYAASISLANEIIFINYGGFMESSFGLALTAIGAATTVISFAEILGEFVVIGLSDRLGKRRLALVCAVLASGMYLLLPWLTSSLTLALMGLFVMFLATEIAIVASIPLYTEVLPEARSVMLSAVVGGLLYGLTGSLIVPGIASLLIGLSGAGLLWRYVHEQTADSAVGDPDIDVNLTP